MTPRRKRFTAPLEGVINQAAGMLHNHLQQQQARKAAGLSMPTEDMAGIVFSGNPHETVPRRLLLDDRLSPLERNLWQVFRLLINADGVTAFPTYEQLRPYLGNTPGKPASRETVAKALTVLRLTRWLSLGRHVRDATSGQMQGNVYILHDEPVGCTEAMEIDQDYMALVGQSLEHSNKAVRQVAGRAMTDLTSDPDLGERLPTRLEVLEQRLSLTEFGIRTQAAVVPEEPSSDSELSENEGIENFAAPSSESELRRNPGLPDRVRNPNSSSTYTNTDTAVCKSSVPRPRLLEELTLPATFHRLDEEQQRTALVMLAKVDADLRQPLLNQWHHRCSTGAVRTPFGYLLSCVQKAVSGEFNAHWQVPKDQPAQARSASVAPSAPQPPQPDRPQAPKALPPAITVNPPRTPPSLETATTARSALAGMKSAILRGRGLGDASGITPQGEPG